jgi:hypothetical protein
MATGPRTTFHDTSLQERTVVEYFDLLSPKESMFLKAISGGSPDKPGLNSLSMPCESKKYEWLEDEDPPFVSTLDTALSDSDTTLDPTATHVEYFVPGLIFSIDDEYMIVAQASTVGSNPTIERAYAGTAAAAHDAGAEIHMYGNASLEDADFKGTWTKELTSPYNVTQLFEQTILVTEMAQAIKTYGIDNALERETATKTRRMIREMNRVAFFGKRYAGTASKPSMMGGLNYYIPSVNVTDLLGGTLETEHIATAMRNIFDRVGASNVPDTIICNSVARERMTKVFAASGVVRYSEERERTAGMVIDHIVTHFGTFDILLDQDCPQTTIYLVKLDQIGFGPMAGMPMRRMPLAKSGPVDKFGVYGTYTMEVRNSLSHAAIKNIAQTI